MANEMVATFWVMCRHVVHVYRGFVEVGIGRSWLLLMGSESYSLLP